MVDALRKIRTKISPGNVKINSLSHSEFPEMAGLSTLNSKKISIYPIAFTSPIYPTAERIDDLSLDYDVSSVFSIVAHELTHAFAGEQDPVDSSGKRLYGK